MYMQESSAPAPTPGADDKRPIGVALVLAHFPTRQISALKYFLLLLNRLQRTFEFGFYDPPLDHPLMAVLKPDPVTPIRKRWLPVLLSRSAGELWRAMTGRGPKQLIPPDRLRKELLPFGSALSSKAADRIEQFDLAPTFPEQVIVISRVTLSNYHYLIREGHVSLLALGEWDRSMAPPSAAEFVQLVLLRAAYSATEKGAWNTIHLGTRSCAFDFTRNLQDTRMMTLVGLGVCDECRRALEEDGFVDSPAEIRHVAEKLWLGKRNEAGTPANIMARFGYDLYFTRGFTSTFSERVRQLLEEDAAKEFIKMIYLLVGTALLIWLGLKK